MLHPMNQAFTNDRFRGWRPSRSYSAACGVMLWSGFLVLIFGLGSGGLCAKPPVVVSEPVKVEAQIIEAPMVAVREAFEFAQMTVVPGTAGIQALVPSVLKSTLGPDRAQRLLGSLLVANEVREFSKKRMAVPANATGSVDFSEPFVGDLNGDSRNREASWVGTKVEVAARREGPNCEIKLSSWLKQFETTVRTGAVDKPIFSERKISTVAWINSEQSFIWGLGTVRSEGQIRERFLVVRVLPSL